MLAAGLEVPANLAKRCKVSRQTIQHWLTLKEPDISALHLIALARALNLDPDWLATGEGSPQRMVRK